MDLGIRGKRALVLGGTSGLGRAVAHALQREGAHVVLTSREAQRAEDVAVEMGAFAGLSYDITETDAPSSLWGRVLDTLGGVDILVLNSGGPPASSATDLTATKIRDSMDALLVHHVELVSLALPVMVKTGWGRIIGIGSSGIQSPIPNLALSNVGRSAFAAYLKTLSGEVAGSGITVNMVLPGRIDTARVAALDALAGIREAIAVEEVRRRSEASIPARRYGTPDEFASVVAFLAGIGASYVTGEQVRCDGGASRGY